LRGLSPFCLGGKQNVGEPKANEGGEGWSRGRKPPPRGFGGCAPKNIKIRGELPTLATRPRVGPKTLANPKPTRVGKGVQGAQAPWQGVWGMCPQGWPRLQQFLTMLGKTVVLA